MMRAAAPQGVPAAPAPRRAPELALALALMLGICLVLIATALLAGPAAPAARAALAAILTGQAHDSLDARILLALRLPRALGVAAAGASLGAAGYLLQVALRNRLAEPQILALNAGASLTMVLLTAFPIPGFGATAHAFAASLGAGAMFALVLAIAAVGRGGAEPARLIFAGVAVSALAHALTTAILILDSETLEELRFWLIGDGAAARAPLVRGALPIQAFGFALGLAVMPALGVLGLGDALARGLGARAGRARLCAITAAACLTGGAVSVVGPIGFVGLIAPMLWPRQQARPGAVSLLLMALTGAAVLLAADLAARNLLYPSELPTGALTGLVGGAAFLLLFLRRPPA